MPRVGAGRRIGARVIDIVVVIVVAVVSGRVMGSAVSHRIGVATMFIVAIAAIALFDAVFVAIGRPSPGRRATRIAIVGGDGHHPGASAAWLRWIAISPFLVGLPFALVGALRRKTTRPFHDRVADTYAVPADAALGHVSTSVVDDGAPDEGLAIAPRPRWRIADAVVAFAAGVWVAGVVALIVLTFVDPTPTLELLLFAPVQLAATALTLLTLSCRRGSGSLACDVGLRVHRRHIRYILAGVALQFAVAPVTLYLSNLVHDNGPRQAIVRDAHNTRSPLAAIVAALAAFVVAPALEESVFRGMLLRTLARRHSRGFAIGVSGLIFGCAHLVDPGAWPVVPSLVIMGIVFGTLVIDEPDNSMSICTHAGANLLPAVAIIVQLFTR